MTARIKNHSLFGLRVTQFNETDLVDYFVETIRTGRQVTCYGYSLTLLPRFRQFPQICSIAETFDVMVADGKGFYHLCRLFGIPLDSDWALYEVTDALLAHSAKEGFSVMLLGTDEKSNYRATENLRQAWPGAKILDGHHGFFGQDEESEVVTRINAQNPDVLMIGMSSPKKEEFVLRNRDKLKAKIIVPMGGVIDIYAGKTTPIPRTIKKLCLTWLYRFAQEPVRFSYTIIDTLDVIFRLIPVMVWARWIKKGGTFSIPEFYGVNVHREDLAPKF